MSKKPKVTSSKVLNVQYRSILSEDWGEDPWTNIGNTPCKNIRECRQRVADYLREFPHYNDGFRTRRVTTRTTITPVVIKTKPSKSK